MTLSSSFDALLLDLDGTIWAGGLAIPGAIEAVTSAGLPAVYVTNNASRSAADVAGKLTGLGLSASASDVVTSAQAAAALAARYADPGDPILVVGAPSFRAVVEEAGFRVVSSADDAPVVVLHGHNPETGWRQLSEAALAITRGAKYVASNIDTTLPSERGLLVGNGSMVAAVTSATDVAPEVAGKPGPAMFVQAAERAGAQRPLAVGDRLDTDIAGAVSAGMPSLHVLTGVSGPWALVHAGPQERPTYVAETMAGLGQAAELSRPGPQGGFSARAEEGGETIALAGGSAGATPLQALLTVLEVAWSAQTPPERVEPVSDAARSALEQWW